MSTREAPGRVYTTVRSLLPKKHPFGYLGRYGRTLSAGGDFTFLGTLEEQPEFNERKRQAVQRDCLAGRIAIFVTPAHDLSPLPGLPTDRLGYPA